MMASLMFDLMASKGCSPDVVTLNSLIDGCCRAKRVGDLDAAQDLFQEMISHGVCLYRNFGILLDGLCNHGKVEKALEMFKVMQKSKMDLEYCCL
ncbi:unnamed protein product [Microthlaspi erraticum]|uniref:Pentacotripeptide-repeat region of PRORP domain-containing protein n=1 Tax=Microthlaspi erraticum TaxID=1685480 RepID=A0A6D2L2X7_9BRAS|nr:unnamed protein product [Microthlaspi erraticum]